MFLVYRAARFVQLLEVCCWQLARMHMQQSDCLASNDAAKLKALLRLEYESDDVDDLKQPQIEVGRNLQVEMWDIAGAATGSSQLIPIVRHAELQWIRDVDAVLSLNFKMCYACSTFDKQYMLLGTCRQAPLSCPAA
jgi:hypothetical protein